MAKSSPDDLRTAGEGLLAEWGVEAEASVDGLVAVLHRDTAADIAIAHRLGGIASDASAAALDVLQRDGADKSVRREAKRARYRLQQRGVSLPPDAAGAAVVSAGSILSAPIEGYISPLDGRGDQLVWLVKPQPGGASHFFAVISDPDGLREVALHAVTRKALKTMRSELERQHELHLQQVDWRYADFLVRRAFDWARARDARMDGDYPALRSQFSRQPAPTERPDPPVPMPAGVADDTVALSASADLLREPELRTWFRPIEELQPVVEDLGSAKDSPLVLNDAQQQERFEGVILQAVDAVFGGALRASWTRRLTEQGVYFAATRRPLRAAQALAAAGALERDVTPRDIPFCHQLVRASLAFFFEAAMAREKEREQSSLVLTPQQAARRTER
ncbi:MAG: hypothetical protein ABI629_14420 [bacterium]